MNVGERNEYLVKMRLVQLRDANQVVNVIDSTAPISSVGFGGVEYGKLPLNISLGNLSDEQLLALANSLGIDKAGVFDKADVYVNNVPYSIKSLQTAPPALVNHTARDGWERVCSKVGCSIDELDSIISDYWSYRKSDIIKEEVFNSDVCSPFASHKEYLLPLLNYFLFKGTGSRDSNHPASYILDFTNPLNPNTWNVFGNEYLEQHWDNLVFSLRSSKGMGNYPDIRNAAKKASMAKWTEFFQGGYKGALHVRVK